MRLLFLFLFIQSFSFAKPIQTESDSSHGALIKRLLVPRTSEKSCGFKNEKLKQWLDTAEFLLSSIDFPTGGKESCAFYDWVENQGKEKVLFFLQENNELQVVQRVVVKSYLWDMEQKQISKTPKAGSSVTNLMERLGNQYLGAARGLSSWDPTAHVNPFLFWQSTMRDYLIKYYSALAKPFSFLEANEEKLSVFKFSKKMREKIQPLHLFRSDYWLDGQDREKHYLGSIFQWKDIDKEQQQICFKVAERAPSSYNWGSLPKKFLTFQENQKEFEFLSRISSCGKGLDLLWQLGKWKTQELIGFSEKQMLDMIKVWKQSAHYFQKDQQSKEALLKALATD